MKNLKLSYLVLAAVVVMAGCGAGQSSNRACYKAQCYKLEIAMSEKQKSQGLQHRDHLDKDTGMLFFMRGVKTPKFWMKETLIPLDIIWLDEEGKIFYIEHAAVPCEKDPCPTYGPNASAAYVLEVNSGEASRLDMRLGERIDLQLNDVP